MKKIRETPSLSQANDLGYGFDILGPYDVQRGRLLPCVDPSKAGTHTFHFLDQDFLLPDYVQGTEATEGEYVGSTCETRDEFQNSVSAHAQVKTKIGAFSGQVEASYSSQFSQSSNYWFAYNNYYTRVAVLSLRIDDHYRSDNFVKRLDKLPATVSEENLGVFVDFFNDFGYYYVSDIFLGGSLEYYVAVSKESGSSSKDISASLNAEYKAAFATGSVSGDVKKTEAWKNYVENRTVNIKVAGGDPALLTQLAGIDPTNPSTATVDIYNRWAESVKKDPAVSDFMLKGIWELCGDKRSVVEEAFEVYAEVMRPRMDVEVSSNMQPVINAAGLIPLDPVPAGTFGFQVVLLDRTDISPDSVKFKQAYWTSTRNWKSEYRKMYDAMEKDLQPQLTAGRVLVVASFGMLIGAVPTPGLYALLRVSGGGAGLLSWMDWSPGSSDWPMVFAMVGIPTMGPETGLEVYAEGTQGGTVLRELEAYFFMQSHSNDYTLGTGGGSSLESDADTHIPLGHYATV